MRPPTPSPLSAFSLRVLACVSLGLLVSCGPLGPIPGGRLGGPIGEPQRSDWAFTDDHETVQLETRPSDPYSVNTWCGAIGPKLYVPTSMILGPTDPKKRTWVEHVAKDPNVRIRIDGVVYERTAVRVTDPTEFESARGALESKYEITPEDRDPEREIWIFRLDPQAS